MATKKTRSAPLTNAATWLALNETLAILESGSVVGYVYTQADSTLPRGTANVQRWYLMSGYVPPTYGGTPSSMTLQQPSDTSWRTTTLSAFQGKVRNAFVTGSDNYIKVDCGAAFTTASWASIPHDVGDFPAYPNRIQLGMAKKKKDGRRGDHDAGRAKLDVVAALREAVEQGGRVVAHDVSWPGRGLTIGRLEIDGCGDYEPEQLDVGTTNLLQAGNNVGSIYATLERDSRSSPNNVLYSHEYAMLRASFAPISSSAPTTVQAVASPSGGFDGFIDAMNASWGTGCSFIVCSCTWSYGHMLQTF